MIATRVDENGECYPSYRRLSLDTGLSARTVQRAIKEIPLDELEIIDPGGSPKDGVRHSTKYRITAPDPSQVVHSRESKARNDNDDRSQIDSSDRSQSDGDRSQNGNLDPSQIDHLTAKAKQNKEQKRLTNHHVATSEYISSSPASITIKKKACVLSNSRRAKAKRQCEELPWKLSNQEIEDLQDRFDCLGDIRRLIRSAAIKCAEDYPDGGPMRRKYFEKYLAKLKSDRDPPGFIEGQRLKAEERKPLPAPVGSLVQMVVEKLQSNESD